MHVIMISPGFPDEMPLFTQALAQVGAHVFGVGDQPTGALAENVRRSLTAYLQVGNLWDEHAVCGQVAHWLGGRSVDRVICLWEPGMVLAARLRESLGVPGFTVEQTIPFRDKERMKQVLDAAGVRTPRHARATTTDECRAAAEQIGYPLIIKPIDGAGSADTYRIDQASELDRAFQLVRHVPEVSVEEYVEGEEYTFDTICGSNHVLFENVAWYRPKPLVARQNEWISAQAISLSDLEAPEIRIGRDLGHQVLTALGVQSGFCHMEWFRTPDGEAVFGEIGGRPPGGRLVHLMNYSCDIDTFAGWAEAECFGRFSQRIDARQNAAVIFKRAQGQGHIQRIEGLAGLMSRYGEHIVNIDLVPVGAPRRDWRQVVSGDGWVVVRHPDLASCLAIADHVSTDLRIFAA